MKSRHFRFVNLAIFLVMWILSGQGYAQPSADFSADANACLQQSIRLKNLSAGATQYEWDFCADDVLTVKSADVPAVLPGLQGGYGFKLLEDNGTWYGFAVSESSHSIFRLDFGSTPLGIPTVTNLGNPGGALQFPHGIDIIKSGSGWFGFVGFTFADYGIVRLDFGSSLSNAPMATNVGMFGLTGRMDDIKLVKSSSEYYLLTVIKDNNTLARINFGNSYLNAVPPANVFESISIPGANLLFGLDVIEVGSVWKAFLASYGSNSIIQLNLGSSLSSASFTIEGNYTFPDISSPHRIRLVREGLSYRAFVANNSAPVTVVDLMDTNPAQLPQVISQPTVPLMIGMDAIRWSGKTILCGVSFYDTKVNRVVFEQDCGVNVLFANTATPPNVIYSQPGKKVIELKAIDDSSGLSSVKALAAIVSALTSPDISFTYLNSCAQNPINFSSQNASGGIASHAWDFGDGQTSSLTDPTNIYASSGSYATDLTVTGSNGCKNFASQAIQAFTPPIANFQLPVVSPVCTNQNYLLPNTSSFDVGSNPTWEWRVNGTLLSSQQDFTALFSTPTSQEIRLKALIPGCLNEIIKTLASILTGPSVDFSADDDCAGNTVSFSNLTSGADAGYVWNFGDGSPTAVLANPSHAYSNDGVFQVALIGSNSLGCQNQQTREVRIYSLPQPDFSVGLPPFSCSASLTPFQNTTPSLTDSNITAWSWGFGDPGGGSSNTQNPSYVYPAAGNYAVELTATSDFGCSTTVSKQIAIGPSPAANFSVGPSCLNQATHFTDISSGGVQSRVWQIASTSFSTLSPSYIFTAPGNYMATLTATGSNGCSNVLMKTITVPAAPALMYSAANSCAGKNALFTDVTSSPADVIVGWNWNFAGNSLAGNPAEYIFASSGVFNVKMTTTHTSGCKYTLSKNVTINPSPTASFTALPDRGAAPLTVQFNNSSQQANQYSWTFYDKIIAASTSPSPIYTFATLGDYKAQLIATNSFGCWDSLSVPITVLVPSVDLIMKDFSLTTDPVTGKIKTVVTILNNSNIPIGSAEVGLFLADKAVVNETLVLNLNPGQSSTQTLSFTLSPNQFDFNYLCAEVLSEKDVQQDNNKRCISLEEADYFFDPYPSPTAGILRVDWISEKSGSARITVHNLMGQKEYEWEAASQPGLNQSVHDLSFLSAGMYYVSVQTSVSRQTSRFLRQ